VRRADRLYRITEYLRGRRLTTAAWLADRLGVSVRTIYRDVADLASSGVPISGEAGVGYALSRRMDLPPLLFDRDELQALAIGLRFTKAMTDQPLQRAAERAESKLRAAMPQHTAEHLRESAAFVAKRDATGAAHLQAVMEAVPKRQVLSIQYVDEAGRKSSRVIWPLAAIFSTHAWSLVAWCELRDGFRSFRLDRIAHLKGERRTYLVTPGRTLQDFFNDMQTRYGLAPSTFDSER